MTKEQFNLKEIKEMSDEEFNNFTKFYEDIVQNKLGLSPIDECLIGMWEMWNYFHRPIDEKTLDELAKEYVEQNSDGIHQLRASTSFKAGYRKAKEE